MAQHKQLTWTELRVGLFVLAGAVLLAVVIFYVTGGQGWGPKYRLRAFLPEVDGLTLGAPVRVDGVEVGNVERIIIAVPKPGEQVSKDRNIEIDLRIQKSYDNYIRSDSSAGLSPEDGTQFASFVDDYLARGDGAISVSAPRGPNSSAAIAYFGEQLAHMGVPRSRILVGTHDAASGDGRVEIGYIVYGARADACGNWSTDAADTANNLPMPDFGCSVQHNIAAMVADPRDLVAPRGMDAGDATRRETVVGTYEKAQSTSTQKTQDQSGSVSSVGGSGQ